MAAKKKAAPKDYQVTITSGVEGLCIYLNGYRIAGPKPWGGGTIVKEWRVTKKEIEDALANPR